MVGVCVVVGLETESRKREASGGRERREEGRQQAARLHTRGCSHLATFLSTSCPGRGCVRRVREGWMEAGTEMKEE